MGNIRLFLWVGLVAMAWLNYSAYLQDHRPPPAPPQVATQNAQQPQTGQTNATTGQPSAANGAANGQVAGAASQAVVSGPPAMPVLVHTDVYDLVIDPHGGQIVRVDLPEYPVHKDQPNIPVRMLAYDPATLWSIQTALRRAGTDVEPDATATFQAEKSSFEMQPGQDKLVVKLTWVHSGPVEVKKVFTFTRGSYRIDEHFEVTNTGTEPWVIAPYANMTRRHIEVEHHIGDVASYSFQGPVLYNGENFNKLDLDDITSKPIDETVKDGWLAGIEHHFVAAVIPPPDESVHYHAGVENGRWSISAVAPTITVAPGESKEIPFTLFIGPKLQNQLAATAEDLDRTVDYGIFTMLAQPLFDVLQFIERYTGNWGWAIVIVTVLIKLLFYKFTEMSGRSMAKMRRLQPRIKAMQERHKDDRQAQSQAMMELYKKERINPAAGCLPMIIQAPFFLAWYWVLIESVEIRQEPFILWIQDLSVRDPYYVLPALTAIAMFFQTRLNPPAADPMQARIMQFMPIAFAAFFALYPSGLGLYYLVNTVLGILQQWRVNKVVDREAKAATA